MPGGRNVGGNDRQNDARNVTQCRRILSCNSPAPCEIFLQPLQLLQSQRTRDVRQPVVEAEQDHLIMPLPFPLPISSIAADPLIAKVAQCISESWIIGCDHPAFAGGEVL